MVMMTHFDMGAWPSRTGTSTVTASEIGGMSALFTYSGNIGAGSTTHTSFDTDLSSTQGLRIEFRDEAFNVGIDNVIFTISAVPEPSTWALMFAGLAGVVGVARRRRN